MITQFLFLFMALVSLGIYCWSGWNPRRAMPIPVEPAASAGHRRAKIPGDDVIGSSSELLAWTALDDHQLNRLLRATDPGPLGRLSGQRTVNITPAERIGRVAVGLTAAAIAGILLQFTTDGAIPAILLEILLFLAGVDLVITGALGHCPLYAKLGHTPKALRRTR